jgi:DNA invertase Pin-like site-specific DNA recombinase
MISTELSTIKIKDAQRADLADCTAAFLSAGGVILEADTSTSTPQKSAYGRQSTPNFQRPAAKEESDQQAVRIKKLAKTMNRNEICEKEEISLGTLKGIAKRYEIEFLAGPKKARAPNRATPEAEALMVIRIKDCIAQGINRQQCCKSLGISSTLLYRLIKDYSIDYPTLKPAFR